MPLIMISEAPIITELLGISLKNKYAIIPTNINDVYSNGEVTETSAYLAACDIK